MDDYKYLGDFSAVPPESSKHMSCHKCEVSWTGCWDNFMCPKCGDGELPSFGNDDGEFRLKEAKTDD